MSVGILTVPHFSVLFSYLYYAHIASVTLLISLSVLAQVKWFVLLCEWDVVSCPSKSVLCRGGELEKLHPAVFHQQLHSLKFI